MVLLVRQSDTADGPHLALEAKMAWRTLAVAGVLVLICTGCYSSHSRFLDAETEPPLDTVVSDCPTDWVGDCPSWTGGDCNVVYQCGCCPGQQCAYRLDMESCSFVERCVSSGHPTLGIGDPCSGPGCPAGTICLIYLPDTTVGHCFEWCAMDDDCTLPDERCDLPSRFDDDHTFCPELVEYPLPLCSDGTFVPTE